MSLKKRLIVSNAAIVVIPVLITTAAAFIFFYISTNLLNNNLSYREIEKVIEIRTQLLNLKSSSFSSNTDNLLNKEYQKYLADTFSDYDTDIIILKKYEPVFSTKAFNNFDIQKCLEIKGNNFPKNIVILDGKSYILTTLKVELKNSIQGNIILLTAYGKSRATIEVFIIFIPVVFLLSFLITNIIYSLNFSKSLVNPLDRLKAAAQEISSGNLNHEVVAYGDSEIRALSNSFEQMRLKLKESVNTQLKYDENRKTLLSSISHDLKTPITSIKGYVEGISDGIANTPEKVDKYLKTIYTKAMHMDSMIDDLLLFSKLDLKQIPFNFEKTDALKYFEDCRLENETELEKFNIKITLHNELSSTCYVSIDRERLKRVVNNIIDNSRKYMNKENGEIKIILREKSENLVIEIQDNGGGIAKEDLLFVFDRFYRADKARSNIKGSGLGLAIAKQIIEDHGGRIWIRSDKSIGTSIMISLKRVKV